MSNTVATRRIKPKRVPTSGFTLVEMLVVVTVVAILGATIMLSVYNSSRQANRAAAEAELADIHKAIIRLAGDTGKFPYGCPANGVNNPQIRLDNVNWAGLVQQPSVGSYDGTTCRWTAQDVARWNGPYYDQDLTDPWGRTYWFDSNYTPYENCDEKPTQATIPALVSTGPVNLNSIDSYDCDDVFIELK